PSSSCRSSQPRGPYQWYARICRPSRFPDPQKRARRGRALASVKVLDLPGLDLTTPSGRGILALLSGLAEEERHRILKRANEGRIAAIKRGTKLGRNPKLDEHQQKEAIKRLKAGESCRAIAKTYRVHHATIARLAG